MLDTINCFFWGKIKPINRRMKDGESELTGDLDGILSDFNANRGNPIIAVRAQCATHSKGQFFS